MLNDFVARDPVQFPLRYLKKRGMRKADAEVSAFLAAAIAWGRRDLIIRSAEKMFSLMGHEPANYVMNGNFRNLKNRNIHRTFFEGDLKYFCRGLRHCYAKYGSLEKLFSSPQTARTQCTGAPADMWQSIALFRQEMAYANGYCYTKHIADPDSNSACKRINLALRWLVRAGPVDMGIWKSIKPSELFIPLDVHVARNARILGILRRKSNDKKAVIELTENLKRICPEDPVKFDFALFSACL